MSSTLVFKMADVITVVAVGDVTSMKMANVVNISAVGDFIDHPPDSVETNSPGHLANFTFLLLATCSRRDLTAVVRDGIDISAATVVIDMSAVLQSLSAPSCVSPVHIHDKLPLLSRVGLPQVMS